MPATPAAEALALNPDGVFLSNGAATRSRVTTQSKAIRDAAGQNLPIFGICLGPSVVGPGCGSKTSKMKFGHHGANHPVQDLDTGG